MDAASRQRDVVLRHEATTTEVLRVWMHIATVPDHDLDPADGVAGFHIHGEAIEAERQARRDKDPHGGMPYANGWQVLQARPLGL